jgi:hypothetical protein
MSNRTAIVIALSSLLCGCAIYPNGTGQQPAAAPTTIIEPQQQQQPTTTYVTPYRAYPMWLIDQIVVCVPGVPCDAHTISIGTLKTDVISDAKSSAGTMKNNANGDAIMDIAIDDVDGARVAVPLRPRATNAGGRERLTGPGIRASSSH